MSDTTFYECNKGVKFLNAYIDRHEGIGVDFCVVRMGVGADEFSIHFESVDSFLSFCERCSLEYKDNRK